MRNKAFRSLILVGVIFGIFGVAYATNGIKNNFNTFYAGKGIVTAGSRIDQCILCHASNAQNAQDLPSLETGAPGVTPSGPNPYGVLLESNGRNFGSAESADSDGDGSNNLAEITGKFFPGNPLDKPAAGDVTAPTVTAFTVPASSTSLTVSGISITATDAVGVTGYIITESATAPLLTATGWVSVTSTTSFSTTTASYTAASPGTKTLYVWARDAAGNRSAQFTSRSVNITLPDAVAPSVTVFTVPASSTSLTVSGISITATDAVGVTGYIITESATAPALSAAGWVSVTSTTSFSTTTASYTAASPETKTLYAWARDAAGNVSTNRNASVTITLGANIPIVDFDGDGKTDYAIFRGNNSNWYIIPSGGGPAYNIQWGAGALNDIIVPGDYDGDGKTDIAVWRPGNGNWYIKRSSDEGVTQTRWGRGSLNDIPVPGDYDGDGKTDIAVWRPGTRYWLIKRSSDGGVTFVRWGSGSLNDIPVPGDYDGDGKTDIAVWQPGNGNWYIKRSSDGGVTLTQWGSGATNDVPVPGDYDGDGKTDIAVWQPGNGNWYIDPSGAGSTYLLQLGGDPTDIPVSIP